MLMAFNPKFKFGPEHIALAVIGLGVGFLISKLVQPKPIITKSNYPVRPPQYPPPTNQYFPDPAINEWSYQNAIRKDYEAMTRLGVRDAGVDVGFPVSNIHPTLESHLRSTYRF
jgi:hypothetical protein